MQPFKKISLGNMFSVKPGRRFYVFLVCLSVSGLFWLLNSLTKQYAITVEVPVQYVGVPDDEIIVNNPPRVLPFTLKGEGFSLLSPRREGAFEPVEIDLSVYPEQERSGKKHKTFATANIRNRVTREVGSYLTVEAGGPDSVDVILEHKVSRKIPVEAEYEITLNPQFVYRSEPKTVPDSITVSGARSAVEELESVFTELVEFKDLSEPKDLKLTLEKPDGPIVLSPEVVTFKLDVERITEGKLSVPIKVLNLPDSLELATYPSNVEVQYAVGLSRFENISPGAFEAAVDYNEARRENASKLFVTVKASPGTRVISYVPEQVEFLIRRR